MIVYIHDCWIWDGLEVYVSKMDLGFGLLIGLIEVTSHLGRKYVADRLCELIETNKCSRCCFFFFVCAYTADRTSVGTPFWPFPAPKIPYYHRDVRCLFISEVL